MKKLLAMILAVLMLQALAMPAFAEEGIYSPSVVEHTLNADCGCRVYNWQARYQLDWMDLETFRDARDGMWDVEDMQPVDLFFFVSCGKEENVVLKYVVNVAEEAVEKGDAHACTSQELPVTAEDELVVMAYVDGEWVEIESETVENGIVFVAVDGPMAIFTK